MKRLILILSAAFLLSLVAVALIFVLRRKTITLEHDGSVQQVTTFASTVGELLAQEGVQLAAEDHLEPPRKAQLQNGDRIQIQRARQVLLWADGEVQTLVTTDSIPAELLSQAGLALSPNDRLLLNGDPVSLQDPLPQAPVYRLQVARAFQVELIAGDESQTFFSSAATVGEALWQAGLHLHEADQVSPPLETPLSGPVRITLVRAHPVTIRTADGDLPHLTVAETVGEALSEAGLALQGLDYSQPPEEAPLPDDGVIRVTRVREEIILEQDLLPYTTEFGLDPEMELGTRGVSSPGGYGVEALRTRIRLEDGQEVFRQTEDQWVALDPQPLVMGYGTKIVTRTLETEVGTLEYWRAVPMYATSYSPCRIFRDRCDSVTSSGATLQHGVAAVTLRHYRSMAYTRVYVPGYGIATILDVGGGIPGRNWIDLGYSDGDYISWHQWVTVYFLTPVPPEGLILYDLN